MLKERGLTEKHEAAVGLLEEPAEARFMDVEELRGLATEGRERGYLTFEEIASCLDEVEVTKEQISDFRAHLVEAGVDIVSTADGRPQNGGLNDSPAGAEGSTPPKKPEIDLTVEPSLDSLRLYLRSIGRVDLLTADQEVTLARRIERGDMSAKQQMIEANLRLVVSIAKRHANQVDNFYELLSDGNMSLIRAVDKFDYSRGNKFSTYATWAIVKNFARSLPQEKTHKERYVTGHDELFEVALDNRTDEHELVASAEQASRRVNRLLEYLDPRDREIVRLRAGLDGEPKTLAQIGEQLGITKERVRQLNVRIMKQLRDLAGDSPGGLI
jgi:RNA polymerase sigma factor (sigma-70 family)